MTAPAPQTTQNPDSQNHPDTPNQIARVREMAHKASQESHAVDAVTNPDLQEILQKARDEKKALLKNNLKHRERDIKKKRAARMTDVRAIAKDAAFSEQARKAAQKLQAEFSKATPKPGKDDDSSGGHSSVHRHTRALPQPKK